jgi:hypothetical protein
MHGPAPRHRDCPLHPPVLQGIRNDCTAA